MKKQIIIILAVLSLMAFSLSAKEIKVKAQVHNFIDGMKHGTVKMHKSVDMDKKVKDNSDAEVAFDGNMLSEYEIVNNDKAVSRINKRLTDSFGKNKYNVKTSAEESAMYVSRNGNGKAVSIKSKDFNLDTYKNKALEILANFPDLKDNLEYTLYSIDTQQCVKKFDQPYFIGEEEISKVAFSFNRLFKGAAIRDMVSYVNISLNASGELETLAVVWPEFKDTGKAKMSVSVDMPLSTVLESYKSLESATSDNGEVSVTTIDVVGLEKSWIPMITDGKMVVTPAHTIVAKVQFSDNGSRLNYSDVPLIEEYYEVMSAKMAQ